MRSLAFLFVFLLFAFSVPAFAGEKPLPPMPWTDEQVGVPDPIPVGYNRCVRTVTKDEYRKEWGAISVFTPPLAKKDVAALAWFRKKAIGRIEFCNSRGS